MPRTGQRRQLQLAKLDVAIGEHLHRQIPPAKSAQNTLHAHVRMFVNRSDEGHTALTDAGAPGDDPSCFIVALYALRW